MARLEEEYPIIDMILCIAHCLIIILLFSVSYDTSKRVGELEAMQMQEEVVCTTTQ